MGMGVDGVNGGKMWQAFQKLLVDSISDELKNISFEFLWYITNLENLFPVVKVQRIYFNVPQVSDNELLTSHPSWGVKHYPASHSNWPSQAAYKS